MPLRAGAENGVNANEASSGPVTAKVMNDQHDNAEYEKKMNKSARNVER